MPRKPGSKKSPKKKPAKAKGKAETRAETVAKSAAKKGTAKRAGAEPAKSAAKDTADIAGVKELVELGKSKGYVTYDDVNELLDDAITEEGDIEDVLITLRESHVEVREEEGPVADPLPKVRRKQRASTADDEREDAGTDYVRMYMRDMGAVPLLTREGEVEIAKRIEAGENEVFEHAFRSPFGRRHVMALSELLRNGEIRVRSVVKIAEPDMDEDSGDEEDEAARAAEDEIELFRRVSRQLGRLAKTAGKIDELYAELAEARLSDAREREVTATIEKLDKRLLKGLRDIPLNPTQVRLVVEE
ncbi:MAG: hypothetical protein D6760_04095, partial [Deltaproteobacteria bacterium]